MLIDVEDQARVTCVCVVDGVLAGFQIDCSRTFDAMHITHRQDWTFSKGGQWKTDNIYIYIYILSIYNITSIILVIYNIYTAYMYVYIEREPWLLLVIS